MQNSSNATVQMVARSILKVPADFRQIRSKDFAGKAKVPKNQKIIKEIKSPAASNITENLTSLAAPKKRQDVKIDDSHWKVKNSSLKYRATKRIRSLAQPKTVTPKCVDMIRMTSVSSVSPSALKYQPSSRIIKLARPKDWMYYEKYQ